jgi:hypothetical protein
MKAFLANTIRCWSFYLYACYRGTGGRVRYVSPDWHEIRMEIPLSWRTRNYVGTLFGGSMYGAVDPLYMVMLIRCLGPDYIVWDKAATIRFKKPGRSTLLANLVISDEELAAIRDVLAQQPSVDRNYLIDLVDRTGEVCASVEKIIYIRRRQKI